jgi:preprotein translocase subunit SecD
MTPLRWRFILILAMVLLAVWFVYPPQERIHLGLDLRGGIHLVLQVNADEAVAAKVESDVETVRALLTDNSIAFGDTARQGDDAIQISGLDAEGISRLGALLDVQMPGYTRNRRGEDLMLSLQASESQSIRRSAIQQSVQTIRNRVDAYGVAAPSIQQQGFGPDANRILIQLPGVEDPETVIDVFRRQAFLEWKLVTYPPGVTSYASFNGFADAAGAEAAFGGALPSDTELYLQARTDPFTGETVTTWWPLKKASAIKGNDLKNAQRGQGQFGEPMVDFTLTPRAGIVFENLTRENIGRQVAILLDKQVLSAPAIQSTIASRGQIQSNFTIETADVLALQLKSGALPASLDVLEQRTVGPSLGMDSIRKGVFAALLGFGLVMLFMVFYYKLSGINAVVALLLNLLLVLAIMSSMGATLTLPGIAGFILTIGMAVDANVLIFERIKEELRNGKSVRASVDGGFGKALSAIVDSNVTTLIASVFLFQYGTGPIRGFAVTLMVGILASMVTALFVSRTIFMAVLAGKTGQERLSI